MSDVGYVSFLKKSQLNIKSFYLNGIQHTSGRYLTISYAMKQFQNNLIDQYKNSDNFFFKAFA